MFRKLLDTILAKVGYVHRENLTLSQIEVKGLEKEKAKLISKCEELIKTISTLRNEILILNDENQSLWGMLDELQASNNFGQDQVQSIMKDLEEVLTDEMLKDFKPIGEA